jgi:hypothetical protein
MLEVAEADLERAFVYPQARRKSLADANNRASGASRWRRGSASHAPECTELTVEGDRGFESGSLQLGV